MCSLAHTPPQNRSLGLEAQNSQLQTISKQPHIETIPLGRLWGILLFDV